MKKITSWICILASIPRKSSILHTMDMEKMIAMVAIMS